MAVKQLGGAPSGATDAATKGYVDTFLNPLAIAPKVGWYAPTAGYIVGTSATGTLTSGKATFSPFWIGPTGWTADTIHWKVTTAQSGGTITYSLGLYGDDGSGWPATAGGPLASVSGTTLLTTAQVATGTFATPLTMSPGLYWAASLSVQSAAPTTAPALQSMINTTYPLAMNSLTNFGTPIRGYALTGLSALPTTATAPASMSLVGGNDLPILYLHRSA